MSVAKRLVCRCDGCGKETEDRFEWWTAQRHTHTNDGFTYGDLFPTWVDFCAECWQKMRKFLSGKRTTPNLSKE